MAEGPKSTAEERAQRLAQALRDNLRRRKTQSRERQAEDQEAPEPDAPDQ